MTRGQVTFHVMRHVTIAIWSGPGGALGTYRPGNFRDFGGERKSSDRQKKKVSGNLKAADKQPRDITLHTSTTPSHEPDKPIRHYP